MARSTTVPWICPCRSMQGWCEDLVALAGAGFERDNWSPRDPGRDGFWQFYRRFRQLLGNAKQMLAALHLVPHVFGANPGRGPQHGKIIEQIGAFADHRVGL